MAIFDFKEEPRRSVDTTGSNDAQITVQASRSGTLVSDAASSGYEARLFLSSAGVTEYAGHPDNQFWFCKSVKVEQVSPIFFNWSAEYDSLPYDPGSGDGNPLIEAPKIRYFTVTSNEKVDSDINDDPIQTVPGESYDGASRSVSDLGVTITKNYATFDPSSFYNFFDSVNSDTFLGFPPGTARVVSLDAEPIVINNLIYWRITVVIHFRKPYRVTADKAWHLRFKHEGYLRVYAGNIEPVRFDMTGEVLQKPAPLNAAGEQIAPDATPHYLTFQVYPTVAFSGMNLGV